MTSSRRWPPLVAFVVLAVLGVSAGVHRTPAATAAHPRGGSLAVNQVDLVCPDVSGTTTAPTTTTVASVAASLEPPLPSQVTVTTTPLGGQNAKSTTLARRALVRSDSTAAAGAVLVSAAGPGASGVVADQRELISLGQHRGVLSARCLSPATDWWITGTDGRVGIDDTLMLANPGSTVANLTVTAWASTGRLQPPKLQAYDLGPGKSSRLTVADYAPDAALVSLHVHANSGRVTAQVLDRRVSGVEAAGIDWIPPTRPPATDLVVPGIPGGLGPRRLILANPGAGDATVSLRLSTASGNFAPAGHPTVLVRAGHTSDVDLTAALDGAPGAVVLRSDVPVTATAMSQSTGGSRALPDIQWHPAGQALTGPAVLPDNTPPFHSAVRIYLTAPESATKVRIDTLTGRSRTVDVPAGRTTIVSPVRLLGSAATGALVLTPIGSAPVYASRTLYAPGAHGPLTTAEQPALLPASIKLPPVVEDPRVALP
ncbi:MAG: hypothetical protein QOJ03_276 [Frankiaceae bacterium]|nr:hypothetical protein [Frankiaceae bacterium]